MSDILERRKGNPLTDEEFMRLVKEVRDQVRATELFLRLKGIHQVGVSGLVHPELQYFRYQHSLQVYKETLKVLNLLFGQGATGLVSWGSVLHLLVAALVHDVGHCYRSHLFEPFMRQSHEELGAWLIQSSEGLKPTLDRCGVDPTRVARHINPEGVGLPGTSSQEDRYDMILRAVLEGDLCDTDQASYLRYEGRRLRLPVSSIERFQRCLRLHPEHGLVSIPAGIKPLEEMVRLRDTIRADTSFGKRSRALEAMVLRAIWEARKESPDLFEEQRIVTMRDEEVDALLRSNDVPDTTRKLMSCLEDEKQRYVPICRLLRKKSLFEHWEERNLSERVESGNLLAEELGCEGHELLIDFPARYARNEKQQTVWDQETGEVKKHKLSYLPDRREIRIFVPLAVRSDLEASTGPDDLEAFLRAV